MIGSALVNHSIEQKCINAIDMSCTILGIYSTCLVTLVFPLQVAEEEEVLVEGPPLCESV